jgi:putative transposase
MNAVISISAGLLYGVARVYRLWNVARAGVYRGRGTTVSPVPRRRPGPQGPMPDADLAEAIRQTIAGSPFMAKAIARSGRGCATAACGPRRGGGGG